MRALIDGMNYDNENTFFEHQSRSRYLEQGGPTFHPQGSFMENRAALALDAAASRPANEPDRQRIAEDIERFLAKGGQITQVPQGVSGYKQWTLQESVNNEAAVKRGRGGR